MLYIWIHQLQPVRTKQTENKVKWGGGGGGGGPRLRGRRFRMMQTWRLEKQAHLNDPCESLWHWILPMPIPPLPLRCDLMLPQTPPGALLWPSLISFINRQGSERKKGDVEIFFCGGSFFTLHCSPSSIITSPHHQSSFPCAFVAILLCPGPSEDAVAPGSPFVWVPPLKHSCLHQSLFSLHHFLTVVW